MSVCPRCHSRFEQGEERCPACRAPLLGVVTGCADADRRSAVAAAGGVRVVESTPVESSGSENPDGEERFVLLLEEPLYEMAAMIREFLQNCGIGVLVQGESIGLLYRLPAFGAPISRSRVYVHESDFQEARELVAHFFART